MSRRKSIARITAGMTTPLGGGVITPDNNSAKTSFIGKRGQSQKRLFPVVINASGNPKFSPNNSASFSLTGSQEELSGIMDKEERQVLRRKRNMIASHLELDKECIRNLMNAKVINDTIMVHIKSELNNYNKVTKMLEVMPIHGSAGIFQRLCLALEPDNPWLSFELKAEMKMEKLELKVEKYIEHEAGLMVRKTFGGSRRLSQMEKDDIHHLVALRTQYAKEVWQCMLTRTKDDLENEKSTNITREKKVRELLQSVTDYLKLQSSRLNTQNSIIFNETSITTREGTELSDMLSERILELESLTTRALLDREALASERKRAMAVLCAAGGGTTVRLKNASSSELDIEVYSACNQDDLSRPLTSFSAKIRESLDKANCDLNEAKEEVRIGKQIITSLEDQLSSIRISTSTQLQCRDRTITTLTSELKESENRLRDAKSSSDEFQRRVILTKLEVAKFRTKADALEKTRRLGYQADNKNINSGPSSSSSSSQAYKPGNRTGSPNCTISSSMPSVTTNYNNTSSYHSNVTGSRRKRSARLKK